MSMSSSMLAVSSFGPLTLLLDDDSANIQTATATPASPPPSPNTTSIVPCSSFAQSLLQTHVGAFLECLYDPFCIQLASGTLPAHSFATFVTQDVAFLHTFSAAYGRLVHLLDVQATNTARTGAASAKEVRKLHDLAARVLGLVRGVAEELEMHAKTTTNNSGEATAGQSNNDDAFVEPTPLLPATIRYNSFLADICATGSAAEIAAATAPCMRLYAFVGQHLVAAIAPVAENHPYREWLDVYGGDQFEQLACDQEAVLDGLARLSHVGSPEGGGQSTTRLATLYAAALRLERAFFRGVPNTRGTATCPLTARPKLACIGVDFDGTLNYRDTTPDIARAAGADVDTLARDFASRRVPAYALDAGAPGSLDDYLVRTGSFEAEARVPLQAALREADAKAIAAKLAPTSHLREHALRVLRLCALDGIPARVFTLNVSRTFVQACITRCGELDMKEDLSIDTVVGEELCRGGGDHDTTSPKMTNGSDKATAFAAYSSECRHENAATVYVGDSVSDIEALLAADIGILICGLDTALTQSDRSQAEDACEAVRVLRVHGVEVRPLAALAVTWTASGQKRASPQERVVYTSHHGWRELEAALFPNRIACGALEMAPAPRCLTAAGSDAGGGAGIQADLKAFAAHGVFGMTALTALTAQNTKGVQDVHIVPLAHFQAQVRSVLSDLGVDAVKTGMVPSKAHMTALATACMEYARAGLVSANGAPAGGVMATGAGVGGAPHLVIDPVMVAAAGDTLVDARNARESSRCVFPFATVVTPNLPEAAALLTDASGAIPNFTGIADLYSAARRIRVEYGAPWVLLKGGHLEGVSDAVDVLCGAAPGAKGGGDVFYEFRAPLIPSRNSHGTGCTLGSSIAAQLALGRSVPEAVYRAKAYLTEVLSHSRDLQLGGGPHGPLNHLSSVTAKPVWPVRATLAATSTVAGVEQPDAAPALPPGSLLLYAITDVSQNSKHGRSMYDAVRGAIAGGATMVQVREKEVCTADYVATVRDALRARDDLRAEGKLHRTVPIVVNDRIDVCLASGADGVHVGAEDLDVASARSALGPGKIVGATAKYPEIAREAQARGADYVGCGAIFASSTKPGSSVIGLDGLNRVVQSVAIGVVAIGGITSSNMGSVFEECPNIRGVALVSSIFDAPSVEKATNGLRKKIAATTPPC